MFTIDRIAYRRKGVFFPIENALSAGKGDDDDDDDDDDEGICRARHK